MVRSHSARLRGKARKGQCGQKTVIMIGCRKSCLSASVSPIRRSIKVVVDTQPPARQFTCSWLNVNDEPSAWTASTCINSEQKNS